MVGSEAREKGAGPGPGPIGFGQKVRFCYNCEWDETLSKAHSRYCGNDAVAEV